jgi:hypothetical protein
MTATAHYLVFLLMLKKGSVCFGGPQKKDSKSAKITSLFLESLARSLSVYEALSACMKHLFPSRLPFIHNYCLTKTLLGFSVIAGVLLATGYSSNSR